MKKYTNKEKFLSIIKKDKHYKGNSKFTIALYKKYLHHLKNSGKCNASILFVYTSCRSKQFYINRGYTDNEAHIIIKKIQSRGLEFYNGDNTQIINRSIKRSNTFNQKSLDEIAKINIKKGKGWDATHIALKYNISIEEAQIRINNKRSKKVSSYLKHLDNIGGYKREWSCRCEEYYIKKNIRAEDIKLIKQYRFDTRSITALCHKYNITQEAAKLMQQKVSKKCLDTFNQKTDIEKKDILIKRTKHFKRYSQSSKIFFDKIFFQLKDLPLTFLYADYERFLWDQENKQIFFYDLTIPEINLIVEYNGLIFHPRETDTWATTVAESIKKDNQKLNVAKNLGFELFYIWEKRDMDIDLSNIVNIIRQRYDNKSN